MAVSGIPSHSASVCWAEYAYKEAGNRQQRAGGDPKGNSSGNNLASRLAQNGKPHGKE